ncbi:hypothetical protein B0J11DRAFT_578781 [Dendryphion nanum]|uniref:Transmembrane protein n=1 Tax=Dendryphion nanum TaxID=256645 RepID=A0A9P9E257_9PLEO|nr:hypothetical protein B0J11DRAFT_578781 [Dendryphion nanum]
MSRMMNSTMMNNSSQTSSFRRHGQDSPVSRQNIFIIAFAVFGIVFFSAFMSWMIYQYLSRHHNAQQDIEMGPLSDSTPPIPPRPPPPTYSRDLTPCPPPQSFLQTHLQNLRGWVKPAAPQSTAPNAPTGPAPSVPILLTRVAPPARRHRDSFFTHNPRAHPNSRMNHQGVVAQDVQQPPPPTPSRSAPIYNEMTATRRASKFVNPYLWKV